jgi:hypothetical protein
VPVVELAPHPSTPARGRRVAVDAWRGPRGDLTLTFGVAGRVDDVRVPSPRTPRAADRLWEHTCFEAFVALDGETAYHEFNLSPSGEWAVFAFRGYRERAAAVDEAAAPSIAVRRPPGRLELEGVLPLERLSPVHRDATLRLGLSAVIETADGAVSYWALRHPPGAPDFHHADAFSLRLEGRAP